MSTTSENNNVTDEAARLDRQYTGDAVNARTDELKQELNRQTDKLQGKYEESGKGQPETDCKED